MALYRVEITAGDGARETVPVEADNIQDARAKARAGAETGSTIGLPVLQVAPTTTPAPLDPALEVGSEWGDAIPSITAPPRTTTFRDFTKEIDPDLFDPGSTTFVPPPVTTVPTPPVTGFDPNIDPLINPDLFDPNAPLTPPGTGAFVPPPTVVPPVTTVPPRFGGTGTTGFADENIVPNIVPPVVLPPAVSGFAGDDNFVANIVPNITGTGTVNRGTVNGAGTGFAHDDSFVANVGPVVGAGGEDKIVVQDPETGLPVITDRELFTMSPTAGYRRAFGNVFGPAVSGIGPIAEYLRRQQKNLTSAFRGSALRDFLRRYQAPALGPGEGGSYIAPDSVPGGATDFTISPFGTPALGGGDDTVGDRSLEDLAAGIGTTDLGAGAGGPADAAAGVAGMPAGYSFENYLRTRQGQPRGLPSAYEQALEDVNYFRGLGPGAVPSGVSSIFAPKTSDEAGEAINLLRSAQRGRYSPLVGGLFGRGQADSYDDSFADYMLGVQDRSAQGQGPQNFFNFAAQRFGL